MLEATAWQMMNMSRNAWEGMNRAA